MEWEERQEMFYTFAEESKAELTEKQLRTLNELLYSGSELGTFEEGSISERTALILIGFAKKLDNELEEYQKL